MKRVKNDGRDVPQERGTLSATHRAAGFAAVMRRLKDQSAGERADLAAEAEGVILGYEAYALGQEYLERGDWTQARQWLRVAARHRVPGAEGALGEAEMLQNTGRVASQSPAPAARRILRGVDPAMSSETAGAARPAVCGQTKNASSKASWRNWEPVQAPQVPMDTGVAERAAAARAVAERITVEARREADELLGQAQRQAAAAVRAAHEQASLDCRVRRLQVFLPAAMGLPVDLSVFQDVYEHACTAAQSEHLFFASGLCSPTRFLRLLKSASPAGDLVGDRTPLIVPLLSLKHGVAGETQQQPALTFTLGCAVMRVVGARLPQSPSYAGQLAAGADAAGAHLGERVPLVWAPVVQALWTPWAPQALREAGVAKTATTERAGPAPAPSALPVTGEGKGCRV